MKTRLKAYLFGGLFLSLMILPRLLYIPLKDYVDTENYENRVYQEKPSLTIHGLKECPGLYEAYFNDYLAFKNPIVAFGKLADIRVFGEVTSDSVLMGKDGWMFYRVTRDNENNIADYQGTNHYSREHMDRLAGLLDQVDKVFETRGMKLILYIVPNKEQVYPEYMPSAIKVINEESRAELLYKYLKEHSGADVYYPLEEFQRAKRDWNQVYRKYDTHWNDLGAFMAAQMIIKDIDGEIFGPESYESYEIEDRGTFSGDLANMLNLQKYYDDDRFLKVKSYRDEIAYEVDYENERKSITCYSSDVQDDNRRIFICRDSFGIHMAEYFAKNYPEVTLMDYRTEDYSGAIEEQKPDVVVIEIAERYTDYLLEILQNLATL